MAVSHLCKRKTQLFQLPCFRGILRFQMAPHLVGKYPSSLVTLSSLSQYHKPTILGSLQGFLRVAPSKRPNQYTRYVRCRCWWLRAFMGLNTKGFPTIFPLFTAIFATKLLLYRFGLPHRADDKAIHARMLCNDETQRRSIHLTVMMNCQPKLHAPVPKGNPSKLSYICIVWSLPNGQFNWKKGGKPVGPRKKPVTFQCILVG